MDRGPVLSRVHDLVTEGASPSECQYWEQHLKPFGDHEVRIQKDPQIGELSEAEEGLLDEIFNRYGALGRWEIVDEVHKLPEWEDPRGGRIPIRYRDILHFGRKTPEQIEAIMQDLEASEHVHRTLAAS